MAIPTISSVSPSAGHTGGKTLVVIEGTNFRLPTPPPATGRAPAPAPSVRVTFDGVPVEYLEVFSETEIQCLTPKVRTAHQLGVGSNAYNPERVVAVEVSNIDDDGVLITGEVATSAAAFTYRMPLLSQGSDLATVMRALIQDLKRQVHPNVALTTSTDYDPVVGDGLNFVALEHGLPAVVISNLGFPIARDQRETETYDVQTAGGRFVSKRGAKIVNAVFDITAMSDDPLEVLTLGQVLVEYFDKNGFLEVPRTGATDSALAKYPMQQVGDAGPAAVSNLGNGSNVEAIALQAAIYGIRLEKIPGLPEGPAGTPPDHESTVGWGHVADEITKDVQHLDEDE